MRNVFLSLGWISLFVAFMVTASHGVFLLIGKCLVHHMLFLRALLLVMCLGFGVKDPFCQSSFPYLKGRYVFTISVMNYGNMSHTMPSQVRK